MKGFTKTRFIKCLLLLAFGIIMAASMHEARKSAGAPVGRTGAPSELTCATAGCHDDYSLNSGPGNLMLDISTDSVFAPGSDHTFTVTITQDTIQKFGFQAVILYDGDTSVGQLSLQDGLRTQIISPDDTTSAYYGRDYITHTLDGNEAISPDTNRWTFEWKAPADSIDSVTIYVASVAANGNEVETGDYVYTTSRTLTKDTTLSTLEESLPSSPPTTSFSPNPFHDQTELRLEKRYPNLQLTLFNISGQTIINRHYSERQTLKIDRKQLPHPGLYIYRVKIPHHKAKTGQIMAYD